MDPVRYGTIQIVRDILIIVALIVWLIAQLVSAID
jgi:hypothetical protein